MSDEQQRWPEPVYLTKDHAINMSLRDYFAAKAMQTMLGWDNDSTNWKEYAEDAYQVADAMMKAREQ